MALGDVKIVDSGGADVTPSRKFRTEGGATNILAGEPVKIGGTGLNYVIPLATGDPEVGTDRMVGVAATTSTETGSADGTVDVYIPIPSVTIFRTTVTTPGNMDTDAELLAILNDSVTYDLTGSIYTVDENETDDPNVHGLMILDGNINDGTVDYVLKEGASLGGLV